MFAVVTEPSPRALRVQSGQIIALRLVDIADGIDLKWAERLWSERARKRSTRPQLSATPLKAMSFGVPPLALQLDPVRLGAQFETADASVRLYDFGVAAFALRVPVSEVDWQDFTALLDGVDAATAPDAGSPIWRLLLDGVRAAVGEALERPTTATLEEDYLIGLVHELDEPITAEALLERLDLAPMLAGDRRPLSDGARRDLLRSRFSYYLDDLVVLAWDRAFIYEPRQDTDVVDVLEVANAQLLEMRYYDELLDDELPRMYDLVEAARRTMSLFAARRYARLARRLYGLVAEVTELTERVDNALQVTEDVYLARVYAAAIELYRVPNVSAAVERKLAIIRDTYAALYSEASSRRAELLEVSIVLLIVIEIVLSLVRR